MRLARVDLARYGHLTDVTVELPARVPDLHILVGANEIGKSTTQAALADLLFGFGHKTDYAFLHQERDLRVGAVIEDGGTRLEISRRKGRKDTLLQPDGAPLDEAALTRMLSGVTRDGFLSQFSLNHDRLRAGGRAILEEKDDLGRMLFQAGAGLDWLAQRLRQLDERADELFRPRGSSQLLAKALQRRDKASRAVKDAAGSARDYQEARQAEAEAEAALADRRAQLAEIRSRREHLTRAQRVIPTLRALDALRADLAATGPVPPLPPGFRDLLRAAVEDQAAARRAADGAREELAKAEGKLGLVTVDEAVLARADEIGSLPDQVGADIKAARDLPRKVAELAGHEDALARLLREIGRTDLTPRTVGDHVPTREKTETLRRLGRDHDRLRQTLDTARAGHRTALATLDRARDALAALPAPRDAEPLRAAIRAAEREAGLTERIRQTDEAAAALRDALSRKRAALTPPPPEGTRRAALPSAAAVAASAEDVKALDDHLSELRRDAARTRSDLAVRTAEREALLAAGDAVAPERLRAARERRDQGWRLVRRQYVDGGPADAGKIVKYAGVMPLADAIEAAIAEADRLADRRFDAAETSARLSQLSVDIAGLSTAAADLADRIAAGETGRDALLARWRAAWNASGIEPEAPAAMAPWLAALEEIEGLRHDLARTEDRAAGYRTAGAALCARLAAALDAPAPADDPADLTRAARDLEADLTRQALDRTRAAKDLAGARDAADLAARTLDDAGRTLEDWRTTWARAMAGVNRPPDTDPADLGPFLDAWDAIRDTHREADGLRRRIKDMGDDHDAFAARTAALAAALAPELAARPAVDAARSLVDRLHGARADLKRRTERTAELEHRRADLARADTAERAAAAALRDRLAQAGADSVDAAWPVVERAETRARLSAHLASVGETLDEAAGGLPEADLRAGCRDLDADALPGLIADLAGRDAELVEDVQRLGAGLGVAREKLEGFRRAGSDAAEAAEDAAQAAAEAVRAAERYIRTETTALMLRHAIERYRKENEGPLLGRAGGLFRTLTLGRYGHLVIDHDGGDKPQLLARPADGGHSVPVDGLSDGARDQLFLALRLAAVDQVLDSGVILPFVADDLFINFDDERAASGLEVLADLATRTQVLIFTHHRHLADLADRRIPGRFNRPALGG